MRNKTQRGMSLIEAIIATVICGTAMGTLAALATLSVTQSKNQGQSVSQATALGAQKLDQLMTMQYTSANTAAPLACASSPCGSLTSDVANYVEYLDPTGNSVTGATSSTSMGVLFTRRWQVTNSATPCASTSCKLIEVLVTANAVSSKTSPTASLACIKAQQ